MKTKKLPPNWRRRYEDYLRERERSEGTIRQYLRDVEHFFKQQKSDSAMPDSCRLQDWKEGLIEQGYAVSSINGMIAAVNGLLCCLGLEQGEAKASAPAAQNFLSKGTAAEPGGISAAGQHRSAEGGSPPGAGAAEPSVRPGSASRSCSISPSRRCGIEGRRFTTRGKFGRSCCRASCVPSSKAGQRPLTSGVDRSLLPGTDFRWTAPTSGRR